MNHTSITWGPTDNSTSRGSQEIARSSTWSKWNHIRKKLDIPLPSRDSDVEMNVSDATTESRPLQPLIEDGFLLIDDDSESLVEVKVDVIAVPCPGASPILTWVRKIVSLQDVQGQSGGFNKHAETKMMAGSSGISPAEDEIVDQLWIRQALPLVTNVCTSRVFLYKHRDLTEGVTLDELADNLLNHLLRLRAKQQKSRPFYFMCHSIGGLVAKYILVKARIKEALHGILSDCHVITFFGTF